MQSRATGRMRRRQRDRAVHRRRSAQARLEIQVGRQVDGHARAGGGRRTVGLVRRLPARARRTRRNDPRGRPARRRHDAVRHPEVPTAARGARCRDRAHRRARRVDRIERKGGRRAGGKARRPLRRRVPGRGRAHRQARLPARRQRRQDAGRGRSPAQHGRRRATPARSPRGGLRRRQHRARRRADRQATRRRGIGDRLPAHARKDAGTRRRARRSVAGRRAGEVAVDDP